jgi:hypothetical protein
MNEIKVEKGPVQLDIGIVLSSVGGNSSHGRNQFHGLVSLLASILDSMSDHRIIFLKL